MSLEENFGFLLVIYSDIDTLYFYLKTNETVSADKYFRYKRRIA